MLLQREVCCVLAVCVCGVQETTNSYKGTGFCYTGELINRRYRVVVARGTRETQLDTLVLSHSLTKGTAVSASRQVTTVVGTMLCRGSFATVGHVSTVP